MEIGLAILLFVCMTALLYVLLSLKITRQVDLQMKDFYKTRIHSDIQEFYREMENYSVMLENRIRQFKTLVERNEDAVRSHEAQTSAPTQVPGVAEAPAASEVAARSKVEVKKAPPTKKAAAIAKGRAVASKPAAKSAAVSPARNTKATKPATPVAAKPAAIAKASVPQRPAPLPVVMPGETTDLPEEDSAIAEELMRDLYAQDELHLQSSPAAKELAKSEPAETEGERTTVRLGSPQVSKFFSRLGKAIEPVIFGDKSGKKETAPPAAVVAAVQAQATKPAADFSEVLRRAEQIKAEKKAERERAEIEARAEFFAAGDSFAATNSAPRPREQVNATARQEVREIHLEPARPAPAVTARHEARNSLAVKDLDQHTINFLIDSLVKDNGYRRQALRALTENNIPLSEIARLSKIDIGELELMRQLGRF